MKILVTGSSGLICSALCDTLAADRHEIIRLVRSREQATDSSVYWNYSTGEIDSAQLEGIDAAVHLAGENIAAGRWTEQRKQEILVSREQGTRVLAATLARLNRKPATLVSASATGYYGDRGDEPLREDSPPGEGFLADICRQWEAGLQPAVAAGIRVVTLRTGVVITRHGSLLKKVLPLFKAGLGGKLGSGRQYMSWIALDDLLGVIRFALEQRSLVGPVNAVAPQPVTNAEFTRTLGRLLHRPTIFTAPSFALRLTFGQMADEMLLSSARVVPAQLARFGYQFQFPDLDSALRNALER